MKMNYLFFCLFILIALSSCNKEETIENPIVNQPIELRESIDFCMTTYNIQAFCNGALPPADIPGSPENYGNRICQSIQDVGSDYVNLQEVWCSEVADAIEACLREAGYSGFVYDEDAGLMSISRVVPTSQEAIEYAGPESGGDHFKNKGFIHTSFTIMDGCTVNIINTHTQADNPWYEDLGDALYSLIPISWFTKHSTISENFIRRIQLTQLSNYIQQNIEDCQITIIGGDFNIKKVDDDGDITREFADLITILQGQPSQLITSAPTTDDGDILDYFIVSNFNEFASEIQNITNTVHDCSDAEVVLRYNVYETDNFDYPPHGYIVGTFDTAEEANEFMDEQEANAIENGDYYLTYDMIPQETTLCSIYSISDHEIVETCIENYNCEQECP